MVKKITSEMLEEAKQYIEDNDYNGFFNLFFDNVNEYDDAIEIEGYTDGGVDMIMTVDKEKWFDNFIRDYYDFDVEDEIRIMRENPESQYCKEFTLLESVNDYTSWAKYLKDICSIIADDYDLGKETLKLMDRILMSGNIEVEEIILNGYTLSNTERKTGVGYFNGDEKTLTYNGMVYDLTIAIETDALSIKKDIEEHKPSSKNYVEVADFRTLSLDKIRIYGPMIKLSYVVQVNNGRRMFERTCGGKMYQVGNKFGDGLMAYSIGYEGKVCW